MEGLSAFTGIRNRHHTAWEFPLPLTLDPCVCSKNIDVSNPMQNPGALFAKAKVDLPIYPVTPPVKR